MNTAAHHSGKVRRAVARSPKVPPIDFVALPEETRTHVRTAIAGWHLSLQDQTLRAHACAQTYDPRLKPVRSCGILLWPVNGIRAVLGVA